MFSDHHSPFVLPFHKMKINREAFALLIVCEKPKRNFRFGKAVARFHSTCLLDRLILWFKDQRDNKSKDYGGGDSGGGGGKASGHSA